MFRTTRFIVGGSIGGGVLIAALVAWATGLFDKLMTYLGGRWEAVLEWISSPSHFFISFGALAVPICIIIILLAITDPQ